MEQYSSKEVKRCRISRFESDCVEELKKIDWNFHKDDTRYLTHPIHRYSSKFPPQIASNLIKELTREGEMVLDNFSGSGTSLVEANLLKRYSVGIDLNPLACIISKAKVTPIKDTTLVASTKKILDELTGTLPNGQSRLFEASLNKPLDSEGLNPKINEWYFESDLRDLLAIRRAVFSLTDPDLRRIALVSFSEIVRKSSKADSSYANIMKNRDAKPKRQAIQNFKRQFMLNIDRVVKLSSKFNLNFEPEIIQADARNLNFLTDESFDLVISHPPYAGAVPYAEFLMLSLLWLGYEPRFLDNILIGGRRRQKDIIQRFSDDMKKVFSEMHRVLKKGRYCCVVIGNPVTFGKLIPLNEMLTELGEKEGFELAVELNRERINMRKGKLRKEYILVFRKS